MSILKYNFSVGRWIQWLLPTYFKKRSEAGLSFHVLWLHAIAYPLQELHDSWKLWSIEQRAMAKANSQTGVLVYHLNRLYDPVLKRISIVNNTLNNPSVPTYHFTVQVPNTELINVEKVQNFVDRFLLVDRTFEVVQI